MDDAAPAATSLDEAYGRVTARYYDGTYAPRGECGDAAWYLELARRADGPVLELGAGSGRVLLPIAAEGIPCTGVDASESMLGALRAKHPPANLRLVPGRMQDFDLGAERFALIFAAFRVFQHLESVDDQLACLANVRRHLAPGGAFAFDVFRPNLARMVLPDEPESEDTRFADGSDEMVRYAHVAKDNLAQVIDVRMRYVRLRGGEPVENEIVHFRMRYFHRFELEHLLARSGFGEVEFYGDFAGTPFGEEAVDTVVVARV